MRHRHLPRLWLMTDERIADVLAVVAALPRGSGVVFRHHATSLKERRALFAAVRRIAARRQLVLVVAGSDRALRGDGRHGRALPGGLRTMAVHDRRELRTACAQGVDLVFASPVFATRSHPGAPTLGVVRLGLMLGAMRGRAVALGGMDAARWRRVRALGLHGWAAIDALGGAIAGVQPGGRDASGRPPSSV